MWITHCVKTSLPWNHSVHKVINGWQQSLDSGVNWRAYLPGLFNHNWLFVAWHLLMMCRVKAEWHILALTLQMFLTLLPLRSRRQWIKWDWGETKLTQPVSQCWPLPLLRVWRNLHWGHTIHATKHRVPDKCSSARLSLGECSSPTNETLHLYDARGQMESLGNKRQVEAICLVVAITERVISSIGWCVPPA